MTATIAIHGHDIIDLVATYPDGIRLSQLMEVVNKRHGRSVTFHTELRAFEDFANHSGHALNSASSHAC